VLGEAQLIAQDALVHLVAVAAVEWWQATHHLVRHAPEAPPVHRTPVPLSPQHFWSKVLA
jgi:hypothetical protein